METASPQLIDDTDFGLSSAVPNARFLDQLRKKPSVKKVGTVSLVGGTKLPIWMSGSNGDNGYYWVDQEDHIIWLVKFKILRRNWLPAPSVTQVLLWKDLDAVLPAQFTSKMFFNFLLKRHGSILSDKEQTSHGERFWRLRLLEAFQRGLNVGFIDFNVPSLTTVNTASELSVLFKSAWSKDRKAQNFRWLIWK